ncbi:MFS transporter [Sporomusa acidovorans]|uniref:Major facilitator superfamily (MFS) profile domain-containing protein n=1 Tax=Sporomusa acidovorans (strain ATCC 49682 / DSM 3132 / Mol) TaxID=1123286 RepID=A0ABZ3JA44_SPOA4|nr:MFS transporter [Sporomusa acidovorans]OZC16147.1 putative MFS family transporter protein [Sporomusa acidovorans DSM 3132]SDE29084.1 Predicted arabinose efflux permease, MFS family [Sporomusa acidovorans]
MLKQQYRLNIFHIIIDGLFASVPILLSFMIISFGSSEKVAGIIMSLAIMVSTFSGLLTKFFSQQFGALRTLIMISLLYGLGFFMNTFACNIYLAGFCFIIAIAGYGLFHNVAFSYLTSNSERQSLGKTMGDFTAIGDIGRIPFASLAGFIAAFSMFGVPGWRIVCLTYGLGVLLFSGYIYVSSFCKKEKINQKNSPTAKTPSHIPSFSLLRNPQYALPISANVLDALASDQIFTFLPFLLLAKGIDPRVIGTFALAFTFGCFLGKVACGRLVDTFGMRKVFVISEVMMALLLVLLVIGQYLFIIVGASLLLGIVTKGTIPVVQTIITEPVREKHNYDDIFAINTFCRGTTNIITPLLFGFIASSFGVIWIYVIMAIVAVCAIIPVLMMVKNIQPLVLQK